MKHAIETTNIVVCGGRYEDRQDYIARARAAFLSKWPSGRVFTLSEHIGTSDRYMKSVRKEFPIKAKLDNQTKYEMGYDQLNDSYLDWVAHSKNTLIILPELDKLYRSKPEYFYQVIGDYLAVQQVHKGSAIRFLISLAEAVPFAIDKVPLLIGGDWRPSDKDVQVVSLSHDV